ncbi:MAG: hypothetical protein CSA75_01735 [Sorangium cellulosum]|nr:MAG: hypothetical protein CSA75_01735 [Sorangium cellulosum]
MAAAFLPTLLACSSNDDTPRKERGDRGGSGGGTIVGGGSGGTGTGGTGTGGTGTGGTGTGGSDSKPSDCTLSIPDKPVCTTCFRSACETQCVTAQSQANFDNFLSCIHDCEKNDQQCLDGCDTQYPNEGAAFDTLSECINTNCKKECFPCNVENTTNPRCTDCFQDQCDAVCTAFEPDVEAYNTCLGECSNDSCQQACLDQYPTAAPFFECLETKCPVECNIGFTPDCDLNMTNQSVECNDCFHAQCLNECNAFEPDLKAFNDCKAQCTDQPCYNACLSNFPTAAAFYECVFTQCQNQCQ